MIKRENYINIMGFMVTELGLSGNDLLVYAIIYGFSQDGVTHYTGTRAYLAEWCGSSERAISRNIRNLLDRGLIEQVYKSVDCHDVHYRVTDTRDKMTGVPMTKCQGASDKMSGGLESNCQGARDKMSGANIDKLEDNIDIDKLVDIRVCDTPEKKTTFKKPTLEVVKTFAERHGAAVIDPERFFYYYEANGWKVGKNNPMKDWRAAFRMWEAREKKDAAPSGSGKASNVPFMENEYSKEHLAQKEADSLAELDKLLGED